MSHELREIIKRLNNRVDNIDRRTKKYSESNLNFLTGNLRVQAEQIQGLQFTISVQQKFIENKGQRKEYEKWLQKEIDTLNNPSSEGGQDGGGKIERVSRTEKGKGDSGIGDKDSGVDAEEKDKGPPESDEEGNERTPPEPVFDKHELD